MSTPELTTGSDVALAENREIEQDSKLDKNVVADHVWSACRPTPKFSSSLPTVTARRIQIVRLQLQNNPRLKETWDADAAGVPEEVEDESDEGGYGQRRRTGDSERSSPCSTESEAEKASEKKDKCRDMTGSDQSSTRSSPRRVCEDSSGTSVDEAKSSEAPSVDSFERCEEGEYEQEDECEYNYEEDMEDDDEDVEEEGEYCDDEERQEDDRGEEEYATECDESEGSDDQQEEHEYCEEGDADTQPGSEGRRL